MTLDGKVQPCDPQWWLILRDYFSSFKAQPGKPSPVYRHPKQSEPLPPKSPHRPLLIMTIPVISPGASSSLDMLIFFPFNPHNTASIKRNYILILPKEKLRLREIKTMPEMTQPGLSQVNLTVKLILSTLPLCWNQLGVSLPTSPHLPDCVLLDGRNAIWFIPISPEDSAWYSGIFVEKTPETGHLV